MQKKMITPSSKDLLTSSRSAAYDRSVGLAIVLFLLVFVLYSVTYAKLGIGLD